MQSNYTAADFKKARDWVAEHGGPLFPSFSAFEWFVRSHRRQLIESGELIVRRGPGGTLVGPNIGRVAVEIMQERQRGAA
ncbi:MAG: hypothetical protein LJE59_07110 [Chromatiaceae bacterium]|nr:hypothetical protein [Chromatiaceae bacterium]